MPTRLFLSPKPFLIGHCFNQWDLFSSVWISSVVSPLHSDDIPWRVSDENLWDESLTSCHLQVLYHQTSFRDDFKEFWQDNRLLFVHKLFENTYASLMDWFIVSCDAANKFVSYDSASVYYASTRKYVKHLKHCNITAWNVWYNKTNRHSKLCATQPQDILQEIKLKLMCLKQCNHESILSFRLIITVWCSTTTNCSLTSDMCGFWKDILIKWTSPADSFHDWSIHGSDDHSLPYLRPRRSGNDDGC